MAAPVSVPLTAAPDRSANPPAIGAYGRRFGIHIFLISFLCLYYLSNASIMLGHYDLGWHLAAGDLIRNRGSIPFQDPWSFTLGDRLVQSVLALGRHCQLDISIRKVRWSAPAHAGMWCNHRRISCIRLLESRCLCDRGLCFRFFCGPAVPIVRDAAQRLSCRFAEHRHDAVLRCFLWGMSKQNEMVFAAGDDGRLGQSARRILLGFLIIGVFGGMALLRRDWRGAKTLTLAGLSCFAAIFINPLGWNIFEGLTATLGHFVQANITEWQPYYLNMSMPGSIPGILYALAFAVFELRLNGLRSIPLETRVLSWLFLCLGIYQFRYISFFFLFSTVPMVLYLDGLCRDRFNDLEIRKSMLAAGIAGMCILSLTFVKMEPAFALPDMLSQQDALYLQAHFSRARLLNHWNFGGLLIFRTAGTVPVFVDGRAATAYPDGLLRDYFSLVHQNVDGVPGMPCWKNIGSTQCFG